MTVIKDYGETYAKLPTAQDEFVFSRISAECHAQDFVICDVFVDACLRVAQPEPDGWHGILFEYHCNLAWLEEEPWPISDIPAVILMLKSIPPEGIHQDPFGRHALAILPELVDFLSEAEIADQTVILSRR